MTKIVIVDMHGDYHTCTVQAWDLGAALRHFARRLQLDPNEIAKIQAKDIG